MALDSDALGASIASALLGMNPDSGLLSAAENTLFENVWKAIAAEYESHYEANMDVLPNTFSTLDVVTGPETVTGLGKVT